MSIVRENHPFDQGYWRRYDGLPRPAPFGLERSGLTATERQAVAGWDQCDDELRLEQALTR